VVGAGGAVASIFVFAVGAILDFAVTASTTQHGFNINTVGVILMIVGAVGLVISLIFFGFANARTGMRRHETTVNDGQGNLVHREDRYA
jgi:hypothetical protein